MQCIFTSTLRAAVTADVARFSDLFLVSDIIPAHVRAPPLYPGIATSRHAIAIAAARHR